MFYNELLKKGRILGSPVSVGCITSIASNTLNMIGKHCFICIANVHMVVTARTDKDLWLAMGQADIVTSDGMPLVWELRRQGFEEAERVSGPDLMIELCDRAQAEGVLIYFYGGSPSVVKKLEEKLIVRFPDLKIAGIESPPMLPNKPEVDDGVVDKIKASGAGIIFVGLGCPKQELWMHAYSPHIPAVLIGVGAAFDFFAGTVKRAPLWMQKSGLEWFYRLCSEPRRLWKRYLVTNSLFVWYWLKERLSGRARG